jgi:hypothetical protein
MNDLAVPGLHHFGPNTGDSPVNLEQYWRSLDVVDQRQGLVPVVSRA